MRTPVGVASCLRRMILKLINSELLHAAGTIVKLPTNYSFCHLHSKKAQDSFLSKAVFWFFYFFIFIYYYYFFKSICSLFLAFMLMLWASFHWCRSFRQKDISLTLKSLSDSEILLICSTSPSAEAPDFVDNLRRYSLIKINVGFTVFFL